jgi:hypothetical protein
MRIVAEWNRKQCSDGRIKKEYLLSGPFTRETAAGMASSGTVMILDYLPKPLVTFVRKSEMNLRAVIGESRIEVWYEPGSLPDAEPDLYAILAGDPSGGA